MIGGLPRQLARVPRAAYLCALVALLNGVAWTALIPPLHVPDENSHLAYAQILAETGKLPVSTPGKTPYSPEEDAILTAVGLYRVIGLTGNRPPLTPESTAPLRKAGRSNFSKVGTDAAQATNNPPLYYALAAVPYLLSPSDHLIDRLALMRLLSALLAALTTIAVFLFLRELLPASPWVWTTGGLLAALEPMAGFMSGGVSPDSLLNLLGAATILAAARVLRRGLTLRRGIVLGALTAAGMLTKAAYYGLVPGVVVALLVGLLAARRTGALRVAARGAAAAVGAAGGLMALYWVLISTVLERSSGGSVLPGGVSGLAAVGDHPFTERLSYMWQLFLPRLPGMTDLLPGFPAHDIWSPGLLGRFGWLDYGYEPWVYDVFWWACMVVAVLAVVGIVRHLGAVRGRLPELLTYVVFLAGVLGAIAWADYSARTTGGALFEQGRYLLPVMALFVGVVGVALRGVGERAGRPLGAALVMATLAASVFAQLMTVERFYG